MGIQFRKIGTTVLAAAAAIALSAPLALAQDAPDATPVPSFHGNNVSFGTVTASSPDFAGFYQGSKSSHHEGFGFGIKGGFLFARFDQAADLGNKTGTSIGIFFGGNRPGKFGVQGELMYQMRKASSSGQDLSMHSLEIPVLFRGNIGSQSLKGVLVYILAGPAVDIQLKDTIGSTDIKSNFQTFNIDFIAGGGVEITRFFIEAREDWGLRNVNSGNLANTTDIKSKTFNLLFGFRIN
jgi:opacity protein-like surface antigen